jgi:hypothetical protein
VIQKGWNNRIKSKVNIIGKPFNQQPHFVVMY